MKRTHYITGMTARGEPMPQTPEEWQLLGDVYEERMLLDKKELGKRSASLHNALAKIESLKAQVKEANTYELMADQLTEAMQRWGWQHCSDGPELIDQIDLVRNRIEELEAEVKYYKQQLEGATSI